jgi:hypothetical protein
VTASLLEQLADLPKAKVDALIRAMAPGAATAFQYDWRYRARPEQLPPDGSWRVWLLMAGRGFGKTRCGAEWVRAEVKAGRRRIALVGPTAADARNVMVEGESGILAISPDPERPLYEPSKRRLTWPNGAIATTYSADEPERLRGPQHDAAWCDELGAWRYREAWDMLMFGMRLGADPRTVVTTTPRPAKLIRDLGRDPICVVTRGSSYENRGNLAPAFFEQIIRKYEGTRLGRQELDAELLEDTPGALWSHGYLIEFAGGNVRRQLDMREIGTPVPTSDRSGHRELVRSIHDTIRYGFTQHIVGLLDFPRQRLTTADIQVIKGLNERLILRSVRPAVCVERQYPFANAIRHLSEQPLRASYELRHAGERASKHELAHPRAAPLAEIFDGEHRAPAVAIEDDLL